jgi:BirA family transcriptional regulator, biotin operon repressor / biotin---[acetyl-CoA-carboxylase] ligase
MSAADWLSAAKLRAGLGHCTIGREIIVLDEATSTSDVVLRMANRGAGEGLVVFAEHQTAGRGQRGNVWESPAGKGLLCSILLRPNVAVKDPARLVEWAVKGIACTLESACLCKATIKPPNDIYIDGRKVAGVLVEMRAQPGAQHLAVVGIGVNVNQIPSHFPEELRKRAISLAIVLGGPVDRNVLAVTLLRNLDQLYREGFL